MAWRSRPTGPTPGTVLTVIVRDGGCVRCGKELTGRRSWDWSIHHRRGRDGKPDSHQPQNLIAVCGGDNVSGCHGWIHQQPREAAKKGWWLSRIAGADPLTVAVLVRDGRRRYLTADGEYSDDPPEVAR